MRKKTILYAGLTLSFLFVLARMLCIALADVAMGSTVHHVLSIRLFPERSELEGRDQIYIQGSPSGPLSLLISPRARIQAVRMDDYDHPYTFHQGRLTLIPNRTGSTRSHDLTIHYLCLFDDPAPVRPVNTDNPGFGISGTISALGTFLLPGAGWYPRVADSRESFDLRVHGPTGTVAVTTGRLVGIDNPDKRTVSHWQINSSLEGLSLSAGPYLVDRQTEDGLNTATYLFPQNRHLSPRYLEASLGYLKRYSGLFGAYPFDGFAVVENFFPTGYGFPAYTLIGGMVLRLPFIPQTSLPHEIVHNWWGNGVLVDFSSGNWCEGLASYTADYLNKVQISPESARDYRRQAMRNFSSLVSPATDFPLSRFRSRTDPVTKAVGYDKATMVFHMLHQELGDAKFWTALRKLYRQFLFKHASWQDLQKTFEKHTDRSLDGFFRQWVERPGAPQMRLEGVRQVGSETGYWTSGRIIQKKPYFDVTLELFVDTEDGPVWQAVHVSERQTEFEIPSNKRPRALTGDPDYHLFRRLAPAEMPPTVNTLKGSTSVLVVVANRMGRFGRPIARLFARALGLDPIRTVDEAEFSPADAAGVDLLFIGLPDRPELLQWLPRELELGPASFQLRGERFNGSADVLFFVARHPDHSENIISLLHPLSPEAADPATVKIPHYGRYSYLAFSDGRNLAKGTWEVKSSPLMVALNPGSTP